MGVLDSLGDFALRRVAGWLATPDDLHILTISLDVEKDAPEAVFALEINPHLRAAAPRLIKTWTFPTSSFGIPDHLGPDQQGLGPPAPLASDFVKELDSELPAAKDTPLWIKFGPVAGYLRLVAWDALLRSALERPVLWLIDLESPPPRELGTTLEVVLCASEPRAKSEFSEAKVLPTIVRSILEAKARPQVRIHVFADGAIHNELADELRDLPDVCVYKPPEAVRNRTGTGDGSRASPAEVSNAWLRWIAGSLDRPVDVVHFVCHGYLASEQGWLALAETPTKNVDVEWSRFIGRPELDPFLVHVGAWSMVLSSPPADFSSAGLRLLANQMCEEGSRSALLHDLSADKDGAQLTSAYRFLYQPGPDFAPRDSALSIYCHPSCVKVGTAAGALVRNVAGAFPGKFGFAIPDDVTDTVAKGIDDALRQYQEKGDGVPPWLATTQRYVEQRKLEVRRLERQAGSGSGEQLQQIEQAKAMLSAIETAVVSFTSRPGGRS